MGQDHASFERASLDPWVSRSEAESSDAIRRMEEHLRAVAWRLDSAERNQSENNRAMSKTASEINVASREQAQAFDQLGNLVMSLSDRMERLERSQLQDGLKDAVKALHQGLSRAADQIGHSAAQVSTLTGNLEQLAGRVGEVRGDVENAAQALEQLNGRVGQIRNEVRGDIEQSAQALEQRLAAVEKSGAVQYQRVGSCAGKTGSPGQYPRHGDLATSAKRETKSETAITRLEESLSRLEAKTRDPALDRRLEGIDRALSDIAQRLGRRIDTVEKNNKELVAELRVHQNPAPEPPAAFTPPPPAPPIVGAARACLAAADSLPPAPSPSARRPVPSRRRTLPIPPPGRISCAAARRLRPGPRQRPRHNAAIAAFFGATTPPATTMTTHRSRAI